MKKLLAIATLTVAATLASAGSASAQTALFAYDDGVGTANAGSYAPGASFTFSIRLTFAPGGTVLNLEGLTYFFEQQNPSPPFNFSLTNRDLTGSQFTDAQSPGITYPQVLNPVNANDLGALLPGSTGVGANTYFIASLTFSISPSAAPGTYLLENTTTGGRRAVITDDQGHTAAIPQAVYTVTVVPEPATPVLLLVGAGLGLAACAHFRRRHRETV